MTKATMRRIGLDDIQLLRYWKNQEHIKIYMLNKSYISCDEQRNWFEGLDSNLEYHFIYSIGSLDIGCVSITKIDHAKKTFTGGIICGDPSFLNHWVNIWGCIKMYNYAFFELDLNKSFATIFKSNKPAMSLNKSFGYQFIENIEKNIGFYSMSREDFIEKSKRIQSYLLRFMNQTL